jgi:hypothetical protein
VILDCCYSGRAIESLSGGESFPDLTEIRGAFVITASDQTAHVPPARFQAGACTSFTGELLDLIRTGIPSDAPVLTLGEVYTHLRRRLRMQGLPMPNHQGTDTADRFGLARNAALLPEPLERFPRPPRRRLDVLRGKWPRLIAVAAGVLLIVGLPATLIEDHHLSHGSSNASTVPVVVGSANFPESELLGEIYAEALEAKGVHVTRDLGIGSRE